MGIKRYTILTIIYLLGVGIYVYSLSGDTYDLEFFSLSISLPIAVWIILPAILLFIASMIHMMLYSFKDYLFQRALKKDFDSFKSAFGRKVLGEDLEYTYKTDWFKFIGKILKMVQYKQKPADIQIEDEDIEALCKVVEDVQNGKVVEIKKYKLSLANELRVKNALNKLKEDPKFAITILKECPDASSELCQKAYFEFLRFASFDEIKKLNFTPTKEMFRVLMERYLDEEDKFDMPLDAIEDLLMKFKADREDYLELAYEIKMKLNPDAWMAMFERLYNSQEHAEAAEAYLYVLYELQMIDKIRDILDNSEDDEYTKFKTLLFLRDHGKNVNSGIFLRFS
jgi:hypothetical protein